MPPSIVAETAASAAVCCNPVARGAVDLDVSARLLDEAEHHAQPKAGAPADLLGREEGFEYPLEQRRRDSGAGVADRDHHVVAGRELAVHARVVFVEEHVAGLEREPAAVGHRIARIDCQIENGRGQQVWIGQRGPCIFGQ